VHPRETVTLRYSQADPVERVTAFCTGAGSRLLRAELPAAERAPDMPPDLTAAALQA
jgi:hypothetical protein